MYQVYLVLKIVFFYVFSLNWKYMKSLHICMSGTTHYWIQGYASGSTKFNPRVYRPVLKLVLTRLYNFGQISALLWNQDREIAKFVFMSQIIQCCLYGLYGLLSPTHRFQFEVLHFVKWFVCSYLQEVFDSLYIFILWRLGV